MTVGDNVAVESKDLRRGTWRDIRPSGAVERLHIVGGWDAGVQSVDRAVDSGAGVLLLIDETQPGAEARAISALYINADATAVVSGTASDLEWMQLCSAVREAMVRLRPLVADMSALLAPDPRLAAMVAAILQAAARRTPIVIAGALPHIAALAAQRVASPSSAWVFSALDDADLASRAAQKRLSRTSWASVDWRPGDAAAESMVRALVADLDAV